MAAESKVLEYLLICCIIVVYHCGGGGNGWRGPNPPDVPEDGTGPLPWKRAVQSLISIVLPAAAITFYPQQAFSWQYGPYLFAPLIGDLANYIHRVQRITKKE